jgi:putative DNA primase/helicase
MQTSNHNLSQFLEQEVFPALWTQLDSAFPEFGFRQKGKFWVATVESITRNLPGSPRPDRVLAYQNTPFGLVIHGAEFLTWIAYVSGTHSPRGREFVDAVRKLTELAGVPFPERISNPKDRQQELFEAVFNLTHVDLMGERGEKGRSYLQASRGLTGLDIPGVEIGFLSSLSDLFRKLKFLGFRKEEIDQSGILSDSRWEGRIIGPWRNTAGQIINFWSRDITGKAENAEKYLLLKGGKKSVLYGLNSAKGNDLILVEGILDAIVLKSFGVHGAVAMGGTMLKCDQVDSLNLSRCQNLTINLDYDGPKGAGCQGTLHAIQKLSRTSFPVFVIPPEMMADLAFPSLKVDPDFFIRTHGLEAYRKLLDRRIHIYRYQAKLLIEKYQTGKDFTDSQLVALIQEANSYSSQILTHPEKKRDLYLFFWQEIIQNLGIGWDQWLKYLQFQPTQIPPVISQLAHAV